MTSGKEGELDISPRGVPRSLTRLTKMGFRLTSRVLVLLLKRWTVLILITSWIEGLHPD